MEIKVRNVNHAFSEIFWLLSAYRNTNAITPEDTRNGPAYVFPEPVMTTYTNPLERVLFHQGRDANPIFHLMESIWMLAGRQDVEFLRQFNSKIGQFSDDERIFNAAYGYRWRHHFGHDQLIEVVEMLRADPHTRQAVIQIWDHHDLVKPTKDKACNTQVIFDTRGSRLNMTVFNRSNDIWWGAYGANAVHFSILQEFVAIATGFKTGVYRQVSNNFHLYTELYDAVKYIANPPRVVDFDRYYDGEVTPYRLFEGDYRSFLAECERFCDYPYSSSSSSYEHDFFNKVACPMAMVSLTRRNKLGDGMEYAKFVAASDWRRATIDWVERRENAKQLAFSKNVSL